MRKKLPEFRLKLETIFDEKIDTELTDAELINQIIDDEKDILAQEEPPKKKEVSENASSLRIDSSVSTRDEEKSPKQCMYGEEYDVSCKLEYSSYLDIDEYYKPQPKPLLDINDIETSPIINKTHFHNFGLFEDISFSTNIPSFRYNSFCNGTNDSPFDM